MKMIPKRKKMNVKKEVNDGLATSSSKPWTSSRSSKTQMSYLSQLRLYLKSILTLAMNKKKQTRESVKS